MGYHVDVTGANTKHFLKKRGLNAYSHVQSAIYLLNDAFGPF